MNIEKWRDIPGFDNYEISSFGRVRRKESYFIRTDGRIRLFKEKILSACYNKGYIFVHLQKTGYGKKYPVHRLVATSFIDNPSSLAQVNHKNGIRDDNRIENLEWVTNEENSRHSRWVLGKDTGIQNRIPIRCLNNGEIYTSSREAAKKLGISYWGISKVLKKKCKQAYGYKFEYA
jgi:hypothetical protein